MKDQIGIITEQNDLGLNFDLLNDKDQKKYQESLKSESDNKKSSDKNE